MLAALTLTNTSEGFRIEGGGLETKDKFPLETSQDKESENLNLENFLKLFTVIFKIWKETISLDTYILN